MTSNQEAEVKQGLKPGPLGVDITPAQDGGVLKEIIKPGVGDAFPPHGATVFVHYVGKLTDGTIFDSTKESGKPFEFTLGKEIVIKAWDIGVSTMKKDEVAIFTCKPEYAYKNTEQRGIPANSTLIFEITMVDWDSDDLSRAKDGGICRTKTLVCGKGYSGPNDGAYCEVHITGTYEGRVFEDRDVNFRLGEGCEEGVIEGVEHALRMFKKGEKSVLCIKPRYAFKNTGNKELGIPGDAVVEYTVELKNFEQSARTWDMTAEERIAQARLLKEKATNYFKAEKFAMALKFYRQISDYIGFDDTDMADEVKSLLLASRLNMALVHLKLNQCYEAKNECDKALEMDPGNVKGLYRRGQAYFEIGEPENAKLDFEEILKIEPNNRLAASRIVACIEKIKEQREREKKIYANMFEKFARKDKQGIYSCYGWWDNEKGRIIDLHMNNIPKVNQTSPERRKQLEGIKKIAQAVREEKKARLAKEREEEKREEAKQEEERREEAKLHRAKLEEAMREEENSHETKDTESK